MKVFHKQVCSEGIRMLRYNGVEIEDTLADICFRNDMEHSVLWAHNSLFSLCWRASLFVWFRLVKAFLFCLPEVY